MMGRLEQQHPVDQLEPGALSDTVLLPKLDIESGESWALRIQMSQAISLKRIADALGDPAKPGYNVGQNFGAGLETIAWSIGQQMKRGWEVG